MPGFIFIFLILFHYTICLFLGQCLAVLIIVDLQEILKSKHVGSSTLLLFCRTVLANLAFLHFHIEFIISSSISLKNASGVLTGIIIESINQFWKYCHPNRIVFWYMTVDFFFHLFIPFIFKILLYSFTSLLFLLLNWLLIILIFDATVIVWFLNLIGIFLNIIGIVSWFHVHIVPY